MPWLRFRVRDGAPGALSPYVAQPALSSIFTFPDVGCPEASFSFHLYF